MDKLFLTEDGVELFLKLQEAFYSQLYEEIYQIEPRRVNIRVSSIKLPNIEYIFCYASNQEIEYRDTLRLTLKELE